MPIEKKQPLILGKIRRGPYISHNGQLTCSKDIVLLMGRGGGLVVSVHVFNSDDPSSNPAGYLICMKR